MHGTFPLLRRLWQEVLSPLKSRIALAILATLGLAGITALYPIVIQQAFDRFTAGDASVIWVLPPTIIVVTSLRGAFLYLQQYVLHGTVLRAIETLQQKMFSALTRADLNVIGRWAPARQASRFTTDATVIRDALSRALNGLGDVFTVIGLVGSMLWLDWQLAAMAALLYPIAAWPIVNLGKRIRRASAGMQDRIGETAALVTESFAGARVVRAYGLEEIEERRAFGAFGELRKSLFAIAVTRARVDPVLEALGGLTVAAVLGLVGWRVAAGYGTIGEFTGFVAALLIASRPVRSLGAMNAVLQEGLAGLARVFEACDEPRRINSAPGAAPLAEGPGRVEFRDVNFRYAESEPLALADISFTAEPGTTLALVGPSGAGKSTALMLLPRLFDASGGHILLDGQDVRKVTLDSLRLSIAYVGQDSLIFDDTALANILCGRPGATEAEVIEAASAAQAHEFIASLPDGYKTRLGSGGGRLSGGQRQRISLARALLRNPRVLLLDEATSALDADNEAAVQEALGRLRKGRTSLVIAHRLSTVQNADTILVMDQGRIVERGTHRSLIEADGVYARLVRAQTFAS